MKKHQIILGKPVYSGFEKIYNPDEIVAFDCCKGMIIIKRNRKK